MKLEKPYSKKNGIIPIIAVNSRKTNVRSIFIMVAKVGK